MTDNTFSTDELESLTSLPGDVAQDAPVTPKPAKRRGARARDGIKGFMMDFAATTKADSVPPATRDFINAAAFLFRK
jgi:hypothetical protein